ncbi:Panacea domain-containing protein [Clostridium lacusfryxellense]|uniref:Panacea domain-containing protein n=1 Tax=Clostridium lacusfryxellense TaxID=205328 RepID=UPI001C0BC4F9|nr:type II toxin-antitoxin system antitoxin SocA domain-containing protein [Clostridium lacusfryxellense]MBU3114629.1 DUF4065 domain-containing protein [Clostridium lacusfryxellense]
MGTVINFKGYTGEIDMININNIANYLLNKESMSNKKLQKICYYAYAWYLTMYDDYLFTDGGFEAWVHGPVNRELYDRFKGYGWQNIPKNENKENLSSEIEEFVGMIYDNFYMHTADELEAMTHAERPWIDARKGLGKNETSVNRIDDNVIKAFYRSLSEGAQVE